MNSDIQVGKIRDIVSHDRAIEVERAVCGAACIMWHHIIRVYASKAFHNNYRNRRIYDRIAVVVGPETRRRETALALRRKRTLEIRAYTGNVAEE